MAGKMQQYLRTEYIQPPPGPPTLDAKNSPLALLAQTCSAIGKELPRSKLTSHTKLCSINDAKEPLSIGIQHKLSTSYTPPAPTPPKHSPSPSDAKNLSRHGPMKREKSPHSHCSSPSKKLRASPDVSKSCDSLKRRTGDVNSLSGSQLARTEHKRPASYDAKKRYMTSLDDSDTKAKTDVSPSSHKISSSCSPFNSRSLGGSCSCTTSSPVNSVSRHATQCVNTTSQQMISLFDTYCVGCQGPHVPENPCCLEGLKPAHLPFYPFTSPASTYPFYAQMLMAASARNVTATVDPTPHVCNWVTIGSGNCGQRFSTADELLTHLKSHTGVTTSANTSNYLNSIDKMSANPYAAYFCQQAAALAAVSPRTSNPMNTSFLSRSQSPLSRYNPYSKTPNMLSQLSGMPSFPIAAGVGPYCSPFALYGQRIGAAVSSFSFP